MLQLEKDVQGDVRVQQRLDYLEEDRPRLLLEMLREGLSSLVEDLNSKVIRAQESGAKLSEQGLQDEQINEILNETVIAPDQSLRKRQPALLSLKEQRELQVRLRRAKHLLKL